MIFLFVPGLLFSCEKAVPALNLDNETEKKPGFVYLVWK
jgi:hypothetical protein